MEGGIDIDTDTTGAEAEETAHGGCVAADTDSPDDQSCTGGCAVAPGGGAELLGLALALVLGRWLRRRS